MATTSGYSYHVSVNEDLYNLFHRFWEVEEISSLNTSALSVEEQECEKHFQSTVTRDSQGRYVIRLPFKQSNDKLGESRSKAIRLMTNLSNKFTTNPNYAQAYSEFISEYKRLRHMQLVSSSQPEPCHAYYLPRHGVLRNHSLTIKLRVVFNRSSRTTSGCSLNDILHTGAKLPTYSTF